MKYPSRDYLDSVGDEKNREEKIEIRETSWVNILRFVWRKLWTVNTIKRNKNKKDYFKGQGLDIKMYFYIDFLKFSIKLLVFEQICCISGQKMTKNTWKTDATQDMGCTYLFIHGSFIQ